MSPPGSTSPESSGAQESPVEGPIRLGSDAHKTLFCRTSLDTFNPYKPAVIDWPKLDSQTRDQLLSLPIWDIAVQTEGRARLNVASYAATTSDPLLRKAIELNAFEEGRHKHVLSNLVAAYDIDLAPEPEYVLRGDPEWAFMVTGYSECVDSFFVNWAAWHRRTIALWRRPFFELKVLTVWLFLIWERIGIARDVGNGVQGNNFTLTGAKSVGDDINVAELIDIGLAENRRRMSPYDRRLLRPFAVPALAGLVRRFMDPKSKRPKIASIA